MEFYIAQGISVLTALTAVIMMQCKDMKWILIGQITTNFLTAATYFLLNAFSGAGICFIAIAQSAVMFVYNRKKIKPHLWTLGLFILAYIGCSVYYYKSFIDIFSAMAAVFFAISIAVEQPARSRFWYSLNPLCWLVYDLYSLAYGNFIMHFSIFVATFAAMIRLDGIFRKKKTENGKKENAEIKE